MGGESTFWILRLDLFEDLEGSFEESLLAEGLALPEHRTVILVILFQGLIAIVNGVNS